MSKFIIGDKVKVIDQEIAESFGWEIGEEA